MTKSNEILNGMKEICQYLGKSEPTVLKWARDMGLPIKKTGDNGVWVGSRTKIDAWVVEYVG